jgi:hypothetical protein
MRLPSFSSLLLAGAIVVPSEASPLQERLPQPLGPLEERALPPKACAVVNNIIVIFKLMKATPFCSSYLNIPTVTSVSTVSSLVTSTVSVVTTPIAFQTTFTSTRTDISLTTSATATVTINIATTTATQVAITTGTSTSTVYTNLHRRDLQPRTVQARAVSIPASTLSYSRVTPMMQQLLTILFSLRSPEAFCLGGSVNRVPVHRHPSDDYHYRDD